MKKEKILVTSALLYANGVLHFGHLVGAYLPADCYVRAMRLLGHDVHFISGSDEYGVAITLSAEQAGRAPKEHVDHFHRINKELFQRLHIDFDHYSRTTTEGHAPLVQEFFLDLLEAGLIEKKASKELYSEEDQRFLADRYVVGTCPKCKKEGARGDECLQCGASFEAKELISPRSKLTNAPLIQKETEHWYLRLDLMKERLKEWIKTKTWKPNVLHFISNYIEDLLPRSITRDMEWGVKVPLDEALGKVFYVWFDAPIGYISASKEWDSEKWKEYWLDPKTKLVHFIGKDNIPFHAVIFPAMLMGQKTGYKLVDELPANEFLQLEGRQFSKSEGWTICIEDFLSKYTVDQVRYALAANAPETQDAEFTFEDFLQRCNQDLVGKLGNLFHRSLTFIQKRGVTPFCHEKDLEFLGRIEELVDSIKQCYTQFRLRRACHLVMELAQLGNVYFDQKQPWKRIKEEGAKQEVETVFWHLLKVLQQLALVALPIIPSSAKKMWAMLGYEENVEELLWEDVVEKAPHLTPHAPVLLFEKLDPEVVLIEKVSLQGL